jgi:hypothetical protein
MMNIAFLILAHKQIELNYKQIDMLASPNHYIYIHFDKKFNPILDPDKFINKNVIVIKRRFKTAWGGFNIIEATLELMNQAIHSHVKYDYFILLSGQCMPVKSNREIDRFFKIANHKSYIEIYPFPVSFLPGGGFDKYYYPVFNDQLDFIKIDKITIFNKEYELKKILYKITQNICKLIGYHRKLPENMTCCFGSQWWALHRTAIDTILHIVKKHTNIKKSFKYAWAPDELFFHSILYNSPIKNMCMHKSLWYIDWNTNGPPKTLSANDYNKIIASDALFARKFDKNSSAELLKMLNT